MDQYLSLSPFLGFFSLEYLLFYSLVRKPISGTVLSSWMVGHVMSRSSIECTLVLARPFVSYVTSAKARDSS